MIIYEVGNGLYVNLTNKCTNRCDFCVRKTKDGFYGDLWLDHEPSAQEVISELEKTDLSSYSELVFCGYGEPTMRLEVLLAVAKYVRSVSQITIRINTNGQGNLINGFDITPLFDGIIDGVSISLNTANARDYQALCHSDFGEMAYGALIEFAALCQKHVGKVALSVVETTISDSDIEKCKMIAKEAGVILKVREFIS